MCIEPPCQATGCHVTHLVNCAIFATTRRHAYDFHAKPPSSCPLLLHLSHGIPPCPLPSVALLLQSFKAFRCSLSDEPSMWVLSWLSQGETPLHLPYCFICTSLMTHQFLLVLLLFLFSSPLPWGQSWWWILCQASHSCCIFNSVFPFGLSIFISRSCFLGNSFFNIHKYHVDV